MGKNKPFKAVQDTSHGNKLAQLEKEIRMLKDLLNVKDNWHSTIKDWVGGEVRVCDRSGIICGKLLWSDRYNVCVSIKRNMSDTQSRVYTKGGINWIEQV